METLGLRPDTPSEDERAMQQEIKDLEAEAHKKDAIIENLERSEDTTYNTTSLSWDTEEITIGTPPPSWELGKNNPWTIGLPPATVIRRTTAYRNW